MAHNSSQAGTDWQILFKLLPDTPVIVWSTQDLVRQMGRRPNSDGQQTQADGWQTCMSFVLVGFDSFVIFYPRHRETLRLALKTINWPHAFFWQSIPTLPDQLTEVKSPVQISPRVWHTITKTVRFDTQVQDQSDEWNFHKSHVPTLSSDWSPRTKGVSMNNFIPV